ncbi:Protein of unknown function [Streptococcus thermophilus]|nr:Protein of unknown function [Streptococcus thermophilus]
MLVIVLMVV